MSNSLTLVHRVERVEAEAYRLVVDRRVPGCDFQQSVDKLGDVFRAEVTKVRLTELVNHRLCISFELLESRILEPREVVNDDI